MGDLLTQMKLIGGLRLAEEMATAGIGSRALLRKLAAGGLGGEVSPSFRELIYGSGIEIVPCWDERYPPGFKILSDYPIVLFCRGDVGLLKMESVTVVGSRKSTAYGKRLVKTIFEDPYGLEGYVFASGLAVGIDAQVHAEALENGLKTVAIVAGGILDSCPAKNRDLYTQIVNRGLVVSEFPPGRQIVKGMFPMRNRLLAALSKYIFVVEAADKSGALITARYGGDYGKDVYTFPGSIFAENLAGNLRLISEGVGIISSHEQFRSAIGAEASAFTHSETSVKIPDCPKWFEDFIAKEYANFEDGFDLNALVLKCKVGVEEASALLTSLEFEGILGQNSHRKFYLK